MGNAGSTRSHMAVSRAAPGLARACAERGGRHSRRRGRGQQPRGEEGGVARVDGGRPSMRFHIRRIYRIYRVEWTGRSPVSVSSGCHCRSYWIEVVFEVVPLWGRLWWNGSIAGVDLANAKSLRRVLKI